MVEQAGVEPAQFMLPFQCAVPWRRDTTASRLGGYKKGGGNENNLLKLYTLYIAFFYPGTMA